MTSRPPAPYPDETPDCWAKNVLEQGVRGEGTLSRLSTGDYYFRSGRWQTIHGPATVVRTDEGAWMIWGAQLKDGRRVHCRRSMTVYGASPWRRRSDDGRSWVLGQVRLEATDVFFTDGVYQKPIELNDNVFEMAMATQPEFVRELKDDSFALSFNEMMRNEGLCAFDGRTGWNPTWGECAYTIARLRGVGETELDFKYKVPVPTTLRTDKSVIVDALATVGWRFQTEDELRRFNPSEFND